MTGALAWPNCPRHPERCDFLHAPEIAQLDGDGGRLTLMFWHLTARTLLGSKPFRSPDVGWWFWRRMRETFPCAMAACLMPNHPHVLAEGDPAVLHGRMRGLMSGLTRRLGEHKLWESAPDPTPIRNAAQLERHVKYVHLNPCRAGLAEDPLSWAWTTHRGLIGAEVDPWVTVARLAPRVHKPIDGYREALHAYVCNDSKVAASRRHFPTLAPRGIAASTPLPLIARAAASVTPWATGAERRSVAVALARHQGWRQSNVIAAALDCSAKSVVRAGVIEDGALRAAVLALGSPLLRLRLADIAPVAPSRRRSRTVLKRDERCKTPRRRRTG